MKDNEFTTIILTIIALAAVVIGAVMLSSSTEPKARRVLEADGYTEIELTGYRFGGCGDTIATVGFEATSPTGVAVDGAVCCGVFLRGCSIRSEVSP